MCACAAKFPGIAGRIPRATPISRSRTSGRGSRPASGRRRFAKLRFKPEEGLEVIATGRLTTFPGSSKYQIVIDALEPAGVGALMALLEERRRKFAAEGLFAEARKKPLPYLPRVIGVVTSPTGAVIRDILHRLADRFPVRVVAVAGAGAGRDLGGRRSPRRSRGFNALPAGGRIPRPDLIIVARGGGSLEDLWSFNEEIVVRAAAASLDPAHLGDRPRDRLDADRPRRRPAGADADGRGRDGRAGARGARRRGRASSPRGTMARRSVWSRRAGASSAVRSARCPISTISSPFRGGRFDETGGPARPRALRQCASAPPLLRARRGAALGDGSRAIARARRRALRQPRAAAPARALGRAPAEAVGALSLEPAVQGRAARRAAGRGRTPARRDQRAVAQRLPAGRRAAASARHGARPASPLALLRERARARLCRGPRRQLHADPKQGRADIGRRARHPVPRRPYRRRGGTRTAATTAKEERSGGPGAACFRLARCASSLAARAPSHYGLRIPGIPQRRMILRTPRSVLRRPPSPSGTEC